MKTTNDVSQDSYFSELDLKSESPKLEEGTLYA
jgi:hypothetical protein